MKNFKSEITSTTQCVRFMLRAFNAAHSAILDSADEENTAGTTTMLGSTYLFK